MRKASRTMQTWLVVDLFGQALGTPGPWAAGENKIKPNNFTIPPTPPLKKHFLGQKRYPRRGPFFGHMLYFSSFLTQPAKPSTLVFHPKNVATLDLTIAMERA